ncbi:MAPEG family protein [Phenylobacterium sp.]|uniref:MAPEG family protein n=1 Tax=Phenylobacterium sp. TaxID=1871053 RepID=UPI0027324F61|nr:MAPEG family protein [Phenylobacterium sp.]MDP3853016.1 MAPEG family protein [Phenylobacterium sp.]
MSVEFWCLFLALVLALVHLSAASFSFKAQVGNRYSVGPRDEGLLPSGLAGRLDRAQRNFLETFPVFVGAVLMVHALDKEAWLSAAGAVTYVAGRALFLPLYAAGLPWIRTFSWNLATLGLVMVMVQVFV